MSGEIDMERAKRVAGAAGKGTQVVPLGFRSTNCDLSAERLETATDGNPFAKLQRLSAAAAIGRDRILSLASTPVQYVWQDIAVAAGDSLAFARNETHGCVCTSEGTLIDVFSPQREDFLS